MLSEQGGLATARQLLWSDAPSEGFTTLWERRRLDLTVEAHVLRSEFGPLFSEADRERALERLESYGWTGRAQVADGNDSNRPPAPAHPGHRPTRPDIG